MMTRTFHSPTEILMGDSALEVLGERIARVAHQVLVVTDAGIRQTGLLEILQSNIPVSTRVAVFDSVQGNPDTATVEAAVAMAQGVSADLIIALGGGSSIDVAKAAAAVLTNGGRIQDYEGVNRLDRDPLPLIAIPTTVGSGSEVTKGAVITDSGRHVKMIIVSDRLFPRLAVLDPRCVSKLPPMLAATTGMDALTHAIEGYVARNANPVSDALNIAAIELIGRHLVPATHGERESLFQMLVAACLAGMGFHDAGLGAVHALANTLGAHYGIHHGTANALFLPYVMEFNLPACPERFARIAVALGRNTGDLDSMSVARSALDAVRELIATTGVPTRLRDVGVPVTAVEALAQDALHQADLPGNPRECTLDDLRRLYHAAA